jgi:hypothetical protein
MIPDRHFVPSGSNGKSHVDTGPKTSGKAKSSPHLKTVLEKTESEFRTLNLRLFKRIFANLLLEAFTLVPELLSPSKPPRSNHSFLFSAGNSMSVQLWRCMHFHIVQPSKYFQRPVFNNNSWPPYLKFAHEGKLDTPGVKFVP